LEQVEKIDSSADAFWRSRFISAGGSGFSDKNFMSEVADEFDAASCIVDAGEDFEVSMTFRIS
jgi:hypothetical protein